MSTIRSAATRHEGVNSKPCAVALLGLAFCACSAVNSGVQSIRLNEVLALSEAGSDWLELHNLSDEEVSLAGLGLRDSNSHWDLEEGTLAANGFLRIFCDGSGVQGRASFKLSKEGEPLTLVDAEGATLDKVTFPAMRSDVSWGRYPDGTGEWAFLERSSPAAANFPGATPSSAADASAADAGATNAPCTESTGCLSEICHRNICVSSYQNETGGACVGDGNCRSMVCVDKVCSAGSSPSSSACLQPEECASGSCVEGACASGAPPDAGPADQATSTPG